MSYDDFCPRGLRTLYVRPVSLQIAWWCSEEDWTIENGRVVLSQRDVLDILNGVRTLEEVASEAIIENLDEPNLVKRVKVLL